MSRPRGGGRIGGRVRALARLAGAVAAVLAPVLLSATDAGAQKPTRPRQQEERRPPPERTRADTIVRAGQDTVPGDSTQRVLVEWAPDDTVMEALLLREGYVVTRYQADTVKFSASGKTIFMKGTPAGVQQGEAILVGDSVLYNDSLKIVRVMGDTNTVRDPTRGSADVVARGEIVYDIARGRISVENITTAVEEGEVWIVGARQAVVVRDTATGSARTFYGRHAILTSCQETEPHYHFEAGELKRVAGDVIVARPAVLYIADIPVLWLPFMFDDQRSGRHSGILTPRFGVSEIVRNSPSYRRHIEDIGYYFAISDYVDLKTWFDWRSDARATEIDPGWMRYSGELRYKWINRFITGQLYTSQLRQRDGRRNTSVALTHQQRFSEQSSLSANINYETASDVRRRTSFNPYAVLATVSSQLNYDRRFGDVAMQIGGTRSQSGVGSRVDQTLPTISLTTPPVNLASWLVWSPSFNASNTTNRDGEVTGQFGFRYFPGAGGVLDSARIERRSRRTSMNLATPLRIGGFDWRNNVAIADRENDYPETRLVYADVNDTTAGRSTRLFGKTFETTIDWETGISLPGIAQGSWNLSPSVSIVNVDPGAFIVRSERTGGRYVHQSKRLQYGVSSAPTFYGLFPGFGPVLRLRHAISPTISYSYAPSAEVSDEYLAALGRTRVGYLGSLPQNVVTFGLSTNIEAKLRGRADTTLENARKIKALSLNFDALGWDFERAKATGGTGLITESFGYSARSDLLPGFDVRVRYSLFEGSTLSDTARFKPYREDVSASFSINRNSGIFALFQRVFGKSDPTAPPEGGQVVPTGDEGEARQVASMPIAGGPRPSAQFGQPSGDGFRASFQFSASRRRPVVGAITIDPARECDALIENDVLYQLCLDRNTITPNDDADSLNTGGRVGAPIFRSPPRRTLGSQMSFNITPKWAASWNTTYDFVESEFATHIVSLQRELHDWRAVFGFTQAPNGNFAFSFFIALNAQPEFKFDYDKRTIRRSTR